MKGQGWPSTYQGEERSIPKSSHNPNDILVELRLLTRAKNRFFEKIITDHPHFSLLPERAGNVSEPELLIVEAGYDHHPTFSLIESLTRREDGPDVFLISEVDDVSLVKKAFQVGVNDFFPAPLDSKKISTALDRYAREKGKKAKKRRQRARGVISFLGGGGGVGTTTAVVNLGIALQQMQEAPSVVVLELNQQAGDLELFINTSLTHSLRDLGNTISKIDETVVNKFLVKHNSGLHLLSSGNTDFQIKKLASELVEPIISSLRTRFDFVLIDCGHTLDATTTAAIGASSRIVVVSTLTFPVLKRTKVVLDFLKRGGIPTEKIDWLLNRYIKSESRMLKEAEDTCGHQASWMIPNDFPRANTAVNSGCPLVIESPKSSIAKGFLAVASSLMVNHDAATAEVSKVKQWVNRIWPKS